MIKLSLFLKIKVLEHPLNYDSYINTFESKSCANISYYNTCPTDSELDLFYYETQKNNSLNDNVCVGPEIPEDSFIQGSYINNVVDEITKNLNISNETSAPNLKQKLQLFSDKLSPKLGKLSQFITVCNLIKNFKDMSDISKITEIECFLISLKTDDKFLNGMFEFAAGVATQEKLNLIMFLILLLMSLEKYLQVPIEKCL